jgi:hypothetical protein
MPLFVLIPPLFRCDDSIFFAIASTEWLLSITAEGRAVVPHQRKYSLQIFSIFSVVLIRENLNTCM